ncbi:MAG TPA: glycoside hydrolase family 30 beta sandwich domain-containing protein [Balneolaceae bacterium]|nr:glycoside hydrolase family 30 beta sandwich domain-containing protein [Balneolaceae bacterium]
MEGRFKIIAICLALLPVFISAACGNNPASSRETSKSEEHQDTTSTTDGPANTDVQLWLTKPDQSALFSRQNVRLLFSEATGSNPTITVDLSTTYQSVDGFGFALTGGSAYLIYKLPAAKRKDLLHELFSTDSTSIGVSYLRVSIGASDLSRRVFSYDDLASGQTDTTLQQFDMGPDRYNLIPLLNEILDINPHIKILGSPWSPPVWMKTNDSSIGGSLQHQYYDEYAQYFVKYLKAMKSNGIHIDAITPQNEPLYGGNNPSMVMKPGEEQDFVKNFLGPAFEDAGLETKIIIYDHNADNPDYPLTVLADSVSRKYIAGSAFHLYGGDISALSRVHDAYPDKNIYFTEQYTSSESSFSSDLRWHMKNLIIGAMRNWSKNVLEWNLASDPNYEPHTPGGCSTCKGALTIGSNVTRNVSYYIVASASKFVRPGSERIASNFVSNLQNVAFKTPEGKKVLIVLNAGDKKQTFDIRFKGEVVTTVLSKGAVGTYVW